MKKVILSTLLVVTLGLFLASCSKDDGPSTPTVATPTITNFSPTSGPVGTVVTITGTNFSTKTSENTVKIGTTTAAVSVATTTKLTISVPQGATSGALSVTVGGKTATGGTFTVTEIETPISVTLNSAALTLYPYPQYTGTLEVTSDVGSETIVWSSSDETVATVDQNGLVTPVALGTATITATVGTVAANATITVADGPVTKLELDNLELFVGDETTLAITTLEADVDVELTGDPVWTSSNMGVATVDEEGNLTAIKLGTTEITVTVDNASAIGQVTVSPSVYVLGKDGLGASLVWKNGSEQILLPEAVNNPASLSVAENGFVYVLAQPEGANVPEIWQIDLAGKVTLETALNDPGQHSYSNAKMFLHNGSVYVAAQGKNGNSYQTILWVDGIVNQPFQGISHFLVDFYLHNGVPYYIIRDSNTGGYSLGVNNGVSDINIFGTGSLGINLFVAENDDTYTTVNGNGLDGLYINQVLDNSVQTTDPDLTDVFVAQGNVYLSGTDSDSPTSWTNGVPTTLQVPDDVSGGATPHSSFVSNGQFYQIGEYTNPDRLLPIFWKNNVLVEDYFNMDGLNGDINTIDIFVK